MTEPDSNSNDNANISNDSEIKETLNKLLSIPDTYREEVSKLLMSKKPKDIAVVKEFMKTFKFEGMTILDAFRVFNNQIMVTGDSLQLMLITSHFCERYRDCNEDNPFCFERCELVVAFILQLNTLLHKENGRYAVDLKTFITFFKDMPPEYNFDTAFITHLYKSIKENEVKSTLRNCRTIKRMTKEESIDSRTDIKKVKSEMADRRHFGAGFLCMRVLRGKSGKLLEKTLLWRKYFASLDDLSLSLYRDEDARIFFRQCSDSVSINSSCMVDGDVFLKFVAGHSPVEVLPLHHCLARPVIDHDNKFLIYTIDQSKYCFKVDTSVNVEFWNSTINYAAAVLSRPNYAMMSVDVFSHGMVRYHEGFTKYAIEEQISSHERECDRLRAQLEHIEGLPRPQRPSDYRFKLKFIRNQIERFETYTRHLRITTKRPVAVDLDYDGGEADSVSNYKSTGGQSESSSMMEALSDVAAIGSGSLPGDEASLDCRQTD